jgi:sugar lactone lactonase YvrE
VAIAGGNGAGASAAQLILPSAVFVDAKGNTYIADPLNHRIQLWKKGELVGSTILGGKGAGSDADQLNFPNSVYVDFSGSVYVSDAGNHRVIMFNKDQEFGAVFAGGRGIGNDQRQLNAPAGVFVDGVGNIYIADRGNSRIQRWAAYDSIGFTIVGNINGSIGSNLTQINQPSALTIDNNGGLLVADSRNNRILKFEVLKSIDTLLKYNKSDEFSVNTYSFNGCATGSNFAKLKVAAPINFITTSSVICEGASTLITAKSDSLSSYTWSPSTGLNITNKDSVIASPKTTTKYTVKTAVIDGCQSSGSITVKVNKLPVVNIEGVNCIGGGDLKANSSPKASSVTWKYNNNNIRTTSTLWRSGATIVAGNLIGGFDSSKLGRPTFVFVDEKGSMYICDQWNHRIQKWTSGGLEGVTVAGGIFAGTDSSKLFYPLGVFVDTKGNIYIADTQNDRIQIWAPDSTRGVTVAGGKGRGQIQIF